MDGYIRQATKKYAKQDTVLTYYVICSGEESSKKVLVMEWGRK